MKKTISIIMAAVLLLICAGCGKKVPAGFTEQSYEYAKAAYELVRDYNQGKISDDDAKERADRIYKNASTLKFSDIKDATERLSCEAKMMGVAANMLSFSLSVVDGSSTTDVETKLKALIE